MTTEQLLAHLTTEGLRIAAATEAGWTYTYISDQHERVAVWVTER